MEDFILRLLDSGITISVLAVVAYLFYKQNREKDKLIVQLHSDNIAILEKLNIALSSVLEHDKQLQKDIHELKEYFKEKIDEVCSRSIM